MQTDQLKTPVLFLVFNRPDTTQQVFDAIRKAKPASLYIAADGPRAHVDSDKVGCAAVLEIVSNVDWECDVKTLFREQNLGCGPGISGAINWFFEHVEEGIILEDDTLPSPSFFRYCSEMLEYYRHDTRIMEISGSTMPSRLTNKAEHSYFFSNWDYIWGWATWKRAWKLFDYTMKHYPEVVRDEYLKNNYTSLYEYYYMEFMFDKSYYTSDKVTWWSVQWGFARKINSGLVAVPLKNMVINLGFGAGATNTHDTSQWIAKEFEEMTFPIRHPDIIMHDRVTDDEIFRRFNTTRASRLRLQIKKLMPSRWYQWAKTIAQRENI